MKLFIIFKISYYGSESYEACMVLIIWTDFVWEQVKRMREEYEKLNRVEMSIWECCELLNEFVDESDPDLDEP